MRDKMGRRVRAERKRRACAGTTQQLWISRLFPYGVRYDSVTLLRRTRQVIDLNTLQLYFPRGAALPTNSCSAFRSAIPLSHTVTPRRQRSAPRLNHVPLTGICRYTRALSISNTLMIIHSPLLKSDFHECESVRVLTCTTIAGQPPGS